MILQRRWRARGAVGVAVGVLVCGGVWPAAGAQGPGDESGVGPGVVVGDTRPGEAFADPKVAELQRTAGGVQRELAELAGRVRQADDEVRLATGRAAQARSAREAADRVVAERRGEVDAFLSAYFATTSAPSELQVLFTADSPEDFLTGSDLVARLRTDLDRRLGAALGRQRAAADAENAATTSERTAAERKADLDRRTADATNRAAAVSSEMRGQVDATNQAVIARQKAQSERNAATAANWRAYTGRLAAAGITPPAVATIRNPATMPAGLLPVTGADGAPQPGVAQADVNGERLLVLPAETVKAVDTAIAALGKPYVPLGEGPTAYSCDGLVRASYAASGIALPGAVGDQMAVLTPVADPRPGDVVFLGPARLGAQGVGIVLDEHTMLAADARLAGVVVADLPARENTLGFGRPTLPQRAPQPVPKATDGGLAWRCGGVELPPRGAGEAVGAWGGYPNGLIPLTALCPVGQASHVLRCDAAEAFKAMSSYHEASFGTPICLTDSYRPFAAQVRLYASKPALAAVPGTSNHGWGLAVDLCGGVQSHGTAEYAWMIANAPRFGWSNPPWARPGAGREEPWHWEYTGP
ncbi:D-alanyl-D-alanine carboxypeptidase family protein [Actinokineospora auranticolor]|uniref:NlpC/P60 family protein n=1 Tax=Actinokineospora auranticolor TaxID=155976 RepID=A0A2S6GGB9_9PSEU|nr:D-alanyl-D-alanine carboxypeptidase family protein [Actinokineospora auranticolor]PPK64196.1 NlpC/P60 family protein [Actinokineospora auranticolor]